MDKYLESSKFIDWETSIVLDKAKELSQGLSSHEDIARACFEYVRDKIKHSNDFNIYIILNNYGKYFLCSL